MSNVQKPATYARHCPGQTHPISDAVCRQRQMRNYPPCQECEFREDLPTPRKPKQVGPRNFERGSMMDAIFKAYDIRGVYPDQLNEDLAWCIGYATSQFLRSQLSGYDRTDPKINTLVVGRDMRKSSPALHKAFMEGALGGGVNCVDVGMIDTSQLYFAVNFLKTCGAVQTTASHNPAEYNGFKITGQGGRPIGQETGLVEIKRIAQAVPPHSAAPQSKPVQRDLSLDYRSFIHGFLRPPLPKLKIVVDASNGMAGKFWPIVFGDLENVKTIPLNFEHNGEFVHDPNPLVEKNLKQLRAAVKRRKANFGICLDGDADRCMVVDETGRIVPCDLLTALLAKSFLTWCPESTILYDLRSSWVVREEITKAGGTPRRERVGHSFMKRAMAEHDAVFGGELSGHFYFRDNWYCDSAFLAVAALLNTISQKKKPISELIKPLRRYHASGERNFECEDKDERIKQLADKYADAKVDFLDGITIEYDEWWCNVRKSNTEPLLRLNIEAKSARLLKSKFTELAEQLGEPVDH